MELYGYEWKLKFQKYFEIADREYTNRLFELNNELAESCEVLSVKAESLHKEIKALKEVKMAQSNVIELLESENDGLLKSIKKLNSRKKASERVMMGIDTKFEAKYDQNRSIVANLNL